MESMDGLLKIGEFARVANTNLRTLRYYEELRLIEPAARSDGGFRYYREVDANRVQLIRDLQELGLPLEDIAGLLSRPDGKEDRAAFILRMRATLSRYSEMLAAKIVTLEEQQGRVQASLVKMGECADHCNHIPSPENNLCEPCPNSGVSLPQILSALF